MRCENTFSQRILLSYTVDNTILCITIHLNNNYHYEYRATVYLNRH